MKLSEFSVKNSLIVNSITLLIVIAGIMALMRIERDTFPNFSYEIVTVRTLYQGATPEVVEKLITIPIEKELKEVDGVKEMGSLSIEGMSFIILELEADNDDQSKVLDDIRSAVDQVTDLPQDLEDQPQVKNSGTNDTPLVEISLSGDMPEEELRRLALALETEVLDLDGVARIARKGIRDKQMWVEVDPVAMKDKKLSLDEIVTAIAAHNVNSAGGVHRQESQEWIIRTSGELETADDIENVVLRANEAGNWLRVGNVATVTPQYKDDQTIQRTDGTRAMNLLVIKKDRADAIRLMDDLKEVVARFQKNNSPKLNLAYVNDFSYYIKRRLNVLISNGIIGGLMVLIPMVFFLSWRVAVGAMVGIITAILTTIAIMHAMGMSVNLISMFGLIIVLGMLVDEDLVVADNITRYLEKGYPHQQAAILGAEEVNRALISTVVTTIIVFLPLMFMSGIFGKFVADIPKVVMIALTASLFQALFVLPSHLADLNRSANKISAWKQTAHHERFEKFKAWYKRSLEWSLNRPVFTLSLSGLATLGAILYAVFGMDFILFPAKGIEAFFVRAEAPIGTPLTVTEKRAQPLEQIILGLPDIELDHVVTQVGIHQNDPNDPFTSRGSHLVQLEVFLKPESKRDRTSDDIMEDLRQKISVIPGWEKISFEEVEPGPPVGKPVAVRLRGDDYAQLDRLAKEVEDYLKTIAGITDIRNDHEQGKGELVVNVKDEIASQAGITFAMIASTVRTAFDGAIASSIRRTDDEIDILVRLPEAGRYDLKTVDSLLIPNRMGNLVPLHELATLEKGPGVSAIKHFDAKRAITVTANVQEEKITSKKANALLAERFKDLTQKNPGISVHFGGEEEDTEESMQSLGIALGLALLATFIVLLITFESLLQTFLIMFSIPFGLVGVVIGFTLAGEPFSFLAMLGMIGLTGIVVDGGTLILVFVNRLVKEGMSLKEAIIEGCTVRFRSIVLTTITTVAGVLPTAYGIGGNDPFIQPMALALNWGMIGSIVFTLYTVPCLYLVSERMVKKIQRVK